MNGATSRPAITEADRQRLIEGVRGLLQILGQQRAPAGDGERDDRRVWIRPKLATGLVREALSLPPEVGEGKLRRILDAIRDNGRVRSIQVKNRFEYHVLELIAYLDELRPVIVANGLPEDGPDLRVFAAIRERKAGFPDAA